MRGGLDDLDSVRLERKVLFGSHFGSQKIRFFSYLQLSRVLPNKVANADSELETGVGQAPVD